MKRYNMQITGEGTGFLMETPHGKIVLYSEAQARIEALEWLLEVAPMWGIYWNYSCPIRPCARGELYATVNAARAAVEGE